jgi:flagellin-like hook-associated protein FlgL
MASGITLSAAVRQNLLSLQSTASLMSETQNRLATGKKVNSALDNPNNYFTSQSLNNRASDLNALLDSIGQAQQTLNAASQGLDSLTKLVQSAKSIAQQARQVAEPQVTYGQIDQTGNVNFTETKGTTTGSIDVPGTYTGGTLSFDVTVGGTTTTITTAAIANDASASTVRDAINTAINANSATAGHVTASLSGSKIKLDAADSDTDFTVNANALSAAVGLTSDASTANAVTSSNLLDLSSGLAGKSLTVTANGGTSKTIVFGNAGDQVSTFAELQTALAGTGVSASLTVNGSAKNLTLSVASTTTTQNSLTLSGSALGSGAGTIGIAAVTGATGTASAPATDATRANYQTQFNNLLSQIDQLAKDASYNGINLLNGDNLKVVFNETGTSSLTISGVKYDSTGLGLSSVSGTGFQANTNIDTTISSLDQALTSLRTQASNFGSNLTTVQARQDFTKNLVNTLQTGADNLVLADSNEEGANLLALQTRQQLSTTALSLSAQAGQQVLRLFG